METLRGRLGVRGDLGSVRGLLERDPGGGYWMPSPRSESRGEISPESGRLGLRDASRSCGGRGEMGTFQMTASSGNSSSKSFISSSSSFTVFRPGCHDCLLLGGPIGGLGVPWLELLEDRTERADRGEDAYVVTGEVDLDLFAFAMRLGRYVLGGFGRRFLDRCCIRGRPKAL
jgi:hypothetical protein